MSLYLWSEAKAPQTRPNVKRPVGESPNKGVLYILIEGLKINGEGYCMKAELSVQEDVVVVNLSGRINMEYTEIFREACLRDIGQRANKIIFNLQGLSFVGSNGIMPFVSTLTDLAQTENKVLRFCGVGSEFKKVFAASPLANIQILESIDGAFASLRHLDFIDKDPA
jgi:anti-anti-sigma factor